ncbi:uncharacterized protein B0H64DRAFT_402902 [Chaetomium fimeti]|jgi:hypothetical protein|uniref:Uncharacterized protein n=1 Tax=Chaetomium fimeti TaxID=1854472 RepID=A0AAE0LQ59_9PEZI|nr:hypothetical protein B0H64DRAFT_402902 [Chaetomium fimeti]
MSTDMNAYLLYMSTWTSETDDNINEVIKEHQLFVSVGNFSSDAAIDAEFDVLTGLATKVRDMTIAADAMQIGADAAAVAAVWSFGLGMLVFAELEVGVAIERKMISNKSNELNEKLKTVDTDISAKINPTVNDYVTQYKANNKLIARRGAEGLDPRKCRSILMQFMAKVHKSKGTLDPAGFRQYAEAARRLFNGPQVKAVYAALDDLTMSKTTRADVTKYMSYIKGLEGLPTTELSIVRHLSIAFMFNNLRIANSKIADCAKEAGLEIEEVEASSFSMMGAVGKMIAVVAIAMSVVDTVLNIIDIVDVVEQTKKMCDELDGSIKASYKAYFKGIMEASQKYNDAMAKA